MGGDQFFPHPLFFQVFPENIYQPLQSPGGQFEHIIGTTLSILFILLFFFSLNQITNFYRAHDIYLITILAPGNRVNNINEGPKSLRPAPSDYYPA